MLKASDEMQIENFKIQVLLREMSGGRVFATATFSMLDYPRLKILSSKCYSNIVEAITNYKRDVLLSLNNYKDILRSCKLIVSELSKLNCNLYYTFSSVGELTLIFLTSSTLPFYTDANKSSYIAINISIYERKIICVYSSPLLVFHNVLTDLNERLARICRGNVEPGLEGYLKIKLKYDDPGRAVKLLLDCLKTILSYLKNELVSLAQSHIASKHEIFGVKAFIIPCEKDSNIIVIDNRYIAKIDKLNSIEIILRKMVFLVTCINIFSKYNLSLIRNTDPLSPGSSIRLLLIYREKKIPVKILFTFRNDTILMSFKGLIRLPGLASRVFETGYKGFSVRVFRGKYLLIRKKCALHVNSSIFDKIDSVVRDLIDLLNNLPDSLSSLY